MSGNGQGNGYTFTPLCRAGQGTIYQQFHEGVKGDGPIHQNATGFQGLSQKYGEMQTAFKTALGNIKTTYTGSAADSMQSAFDPLVKGMGDGQTMSQQASTALTNQAGQFTTAQSKINNTVPVPDQPWYGDYVPWNTDHDDAVDKNNSINNANAAAYSAYGKSTTSNVQTFPGFTDNDTMNANSISLSSNQVGPVGNGSGGYSGSGTGGGGGYSSHNVGGTGGGGGGSYQSGTNPGGGQYNPGGIGADGNGQYVPPPGPSSTNLQGAGGGGGYPTGGGSWSYPGGGSGGDGSGGGGFGGGFPVGGGGFGGGGGGSYGGSGGGSAGSYGSARGAMGSGSTAGAGAKPGAGAAAGMGAGEEGGRMGSGMAGARGAAGANSGMMGGGQGRGGKKEEDGEHKSAAYLVTEEDEIVGDLPATLPPGGVIGG
ncbi:WXG100 family type VII secretion target [Kutzneria sp. CA-103260]|uniref:WXG100 family type VII secretion target n=1 Tax=Kutzneria sp. CA-103260 TaxID=2802641 RepID=UPI001BA72CEB|nr:PPE domain-containing protein [Kutzneria sp. CA-103260]QUQ71126.1 PPE family protein [Kutzneria sp. CA-103260]